MMPGTSLPLFFYDAGDKSAIAFLWCQGQVCHCFFMMPGTSLPLLFYDARDKSAIVLFFVVVVSFWCQGQVCHWFFMMPGTSQPLFFHRIQASGQHMGQKCRQVYPDRWGTMFWLKSAATYSARSKRIMLCRLYSWTECKFVVRNHSTAAVLGLIVGDVNFNFLCFVHSARFRFLQVWCHSVFWNIRTLCPITFWSPGHIVLLDV